MQGDPRSNAVGRNQDREVVIGIGEPDDLVAERRSPKCDSTMDIVGTQDDGPEAEHGLTQTRRTQALMNSATWRRHSTEHLSACTLTNVV
jgi:hypothetical protein